MREGDKPVKKTSRKTLKIIRNCWRTNKSRGLDVVLQNSWGL